MPEPLYIQLAHLPNTLTVGGDFLVHGPRAAAHPCETRCWRIGAAAALYKGQCMECGSPWPTMPALDLTPPPLDEATGWPTRADGMLLAVGMLARAHGLDPSYGAIWEKTGRFEWTLTVAFKRGWSAGAPPLAENRRVFRPEVTKRTREMMERPHTGPLYVECPALAKLDEDDPHIDRRALMLLFPIPPKS